MVPGRVDPTKLAVVTHDRVIEVEPEGGIDGLAGQAIFLVQADNNVNGVRSVPQQDRHGHMGQGRTFAYCVHPPAVVGPDYALAAHTGRVNGGRIGRGHRPAVEQARRPGHRRATAFQGGRSAVTRG